MRVLAYLNEHTSKNMIRRNNCHYMRKINNPINIE